MTAMREQAIEMIKRIPEDKIYSLVNIIENTEGLVGTTRLVDMDESMKAYHELQKYRKNGNRRYRL